MPEENVQTNQQPTQASETQPQPETNTRPEWLHDKFQSVDDQAKAYFEAEKALGRERNEKTQLWQLVQNAYDFDEAGRPIPRTQQQQNIPDPQPSAQETFDWDNPLASIKKVVESSVSFKPDDIEKAIAKAIAPVMDIVSNNSVDTILNRFANIPQEVKDSAREVIKQLPAQQRLEGAAVEMIIKAELGNYALNKMLNQPPEPAPQPSGGNSFPLSDGRAIGSAGPQAGMSEDEKIAAAAMGISEADWLANKQKVVQR